MHQSDPFLLEDTYQIPTYAKLPIAIERGEGAYVWDTNGTCYLDFYGGHCVTMLGHCPPRVVQAVQQQAATLMFYSNVVYNPVRARAARLLAEMAPADLGHIFFCNSGTEANETALKLARSWTGKTGVIATIGGFHGRTLGSLATTWNPKYRDPYADVLPPTHFVPFADAAAVEAVFGRHDDIAAVILEPIQSMAGIVEAPADYIHALRRLCDRHGTALIFDEVQTGVGRTGTFTFSEQVGVVPDLITLAKSLGSGVPVGAVLASGVMAEQVKPGDQGTTFGGGMLAMAAVAATLETLREDDLMARAIAIFDRITDIVAPYGVTTRGRGCLIGLVLDGPARPVLARLREHGVLAGSADDPHVIRLMPPLTTTEADCDVFAAACSDALSVELHVTG